MAIPSALASFPKNEINFFGGIILFNKTSKIFYQIEFGCGDNLTQYDREAGYDDYLNYFVSTLLDEAKYDSVLSEINEGEDIDSIGELLDTDSGMFMVKHKDYNNSGDLREYLSDVLKYIGYEGDFSDLVFIENYL